MYHDLEVAEKAGPEGRIGLVTGKSHGHNNLVIPARSQKFVLGTVRNRSGRTVTALIDEVNPHRLPKGVDTICSLVKIGTGFRRVKVCLQNQTDHGIQLPNKCVLAGVFVPASVSSAKSDESKTPFSPVAESAQCYATNATHGSAVPPSASPKITEDEFKYFPFVWGPVDPKWRDRILKLGYSHLEVFSQHEWDRCHHSIAG